MATERNILEELKSAQAAVKTLNTQREKLLGDKGREEQRLADAVESLKVLGVDNADKLSIFDMEALRDGAQADLIKALDAVQQQIASAKAVLAQYDAESK
jgi:septal ring factor EnvC (AmiA/AmiB activator)